MEDYQPLSHLLSKLATPALLTLAKEAVSEGAPPAAQVLLESSSQVLAAAVDEEAIVAAREAGDVIPEVQEFVAPSLSEQALRLLQALVAGHDQVGMHCLCYLANVLEQVSLCECYAFCGSSCMGPFWAEFTASCMVLLDSSSHSRYVCYRQTLAHFVFGDQVGSRPLQLLPVAMLHLLCVQVGLCLSCRRLGPVKA